jgi:hypothetical protein
MIALGNIIELTRALDHRTYSNEHVNLEEAQEQVTAISRYHTFIGWYSQNFCLIMQGQWFNPGYLFRRRLVDFAASVCNYFHSEYKQMDKEDRVKGLTPAHLSNVILDHLQTNWLAMEPAIKAAFHQPSPFLYYTSPSFTLVRNR